MTTIKTVLDVTKFGAKGDGSTDDTNAFKRAISELKVGFAGGNIQNGRIYIPAGVYKITDELTVPFMTGFVFAGDSRGGTIIRQYTNNKPVFTFGTSLTHSWRIQDIQFDYNTQQTTANTRGSHIYFDLLSGDSSGFFNVEIVSCGFTKGYYGLLLNPNVQLAVWGITVKKCNFGSSSGGAVKLLPNPAVGQPMIKLEDCYIHCQGMAETAVLLGYCDTVYMDNVEFNQGSFTSVPQLEISTCYNITLVNCRSELVALNTGGSNYFFWNFPNSSVYIKGCSMTNISISSGGDTYFLNAGTNGKMTVEGFVVDTVTFVSGGTGTAAKADDFLSAVNLRAPAPLIRYNQAWRPRVDVDLTPRTYDVDVTAFGAKVDGSTDDSAAVLAAMTFIWNQKGNLPNITSGGDNNKTMLHTLTFPAGICRIVNPESLFPSSFNSISVTGFTIRGAGKWQTTILYDPPSVFETASLTSSAGCSVNGNVTVTLDGVAKTVALTTTQNTATLVATAIRAASYPGWTTGGSGTTVTFTSTTSGVKTDAVYAAGSTGATGTMTTTTQGVDKYLFYNNNTIGNVLVENLAFSANSIHANFMYSSSLNARAAAQRFVFSNVAWGGTWNNGIRLEGDNNNSEFGWNDCSIAGTWNRFLYVPASVGTSGDQFVNYNFHDTHFEVVKGNFLDFQYGGSINIWGGSLSLSSSTAGQGGTFVTLGNSVHTNGAQRFMMTGTRVEMMNADDQLINCSWSSGTVTFLNVDTSVQQSNGSTTGVNTVFNLGNDSGPVISWIGCTLQGKHEYQFGSTGYQREARVIYQSCEFWHYKSAADFIVFTGSVPASRPLIKFDMCHGTPGTDQSTYAFDTVLNWDYARVGMSQSRFVTFHNPSSGGYPKTGETVDVYLPIGAVIHRILFQMDAASVTSAVTGWEFTIKTSETTPTVLANAVPDADDPRKGFAKFTGTYFKCDSDTKRHIVLSTSSAVDQWGTGTCLIEYYA